MLLLGQKKIRDRLFTLFTADGGKCFLSTQPEVSTGIQCLLNKSFNNEVSLIDFVVKE